MEQQAQQEIAKGGFTATLRRCIPGHEAEYFPLFEKFCQLQGEEEHLFSIGDGEAALAKQTEARAVRQQMLAHQEVVDEAEFPNLVTNLGRNFALDTIFRGSAYTVAANLGLKGTGAANAADTQASHAGWAEVGGTNAPAYTGNRKTITFAAASGQSITHTAVTYAFTSSGTVAGAFMNLSGSATKDNTTGTLFSAGDFTGGNRTVGNGDTLDVTYTVNG